MQLFSYCQKCENHDVDSTFLIQSNGNRMGDSEVMSVKPQEGTPGKAEATLRIEGQKATSQVSLLWCSYSHKHNSSTHKNK